MISEVCIHFAYIHTLSNFLKRFDFFFHFCCCFLFSHFGFLSKNVWNRKYLHLFWKSNVTKVADKCVLSACFTQIKQSKAKRKRKNGKKDRICEHIKYLWWHHKVQSANRYLIGIGVYWFDSNGHVCVSVSLWSVKKFVHKYYGTHHIFPFFFTSFLYTYMHTYGLAWNQSINQSNVHRKFVWVRAFRWTRVSYG